MKIDNDFKIDFSYKKHLINAEVNPHQQIKYIINLAKDLYKFPTYTEIKLFYNNINLKEYENEMLDDYFKNKILLLKITAINKKNNLKCKCCESILVRFFCRHCKEYSCEECKKIKHKNCLDNELIQINLSKLIQGLKIYSNKLQNEILDIIKISNNFSKNNINEKDSIERISKDFFYVYEKKKKIIEQINKNFNKKEMTIKDFEKYLNKLIEKEGFYNTRLNLIKKYFKEENGRDEDEKYNKENNGREFITLLRDEDEKQNEENNDNNKEFKDEDENQHFELITLKKE